ncbi:MAG: Glutamate--tRNA ligase 1, partial [Alphaproteobacteria bacterium MarineAlpha5_Bin9]
EIIEMDKIIKKFDIKKISKSSSIFNYKKIDFFNNYYLKKYFDIDLIKNFYENNYENKIDFKLNHLKIKNIFEIHKEKINTIHDFVKIINIYFDTNFTTLPNKILDIKFDKYLQKFKDELNKLNNWDESNLNYLLNNFINKEKIKFGNFAKPLRQLLTNEKDGISINSLIYLLGKEVTISRISNYLIK